MDVAQQMDALAKQTKQAAAGVPAAPEENNGGVSFRGSDINQAEAPAATAAAPEATPEVATTNPFTGAKLPPQQTLRPTDKPQGHDGQHLKKTAAYYDELEINMDDLAQLESRVEELERYVGCEGFDMDYFLKGDIEKLDSKCNRLDDFIKVIEDKNFMLNDLFTKYEQLENFLKDGNKFQAQCIDLAKKSNFVVENGDYLAAYFKKLKEMQQLENFLNFQPVLDPKEKVEKLKQLDMTHLRQLMKSSENTNELETLLTDYNEMVQQISSQIEYLDMITTTEEDKEATGEQGKNAE